MKNNPRRVLLFSACMVLMGLCGRASAEVDDLLVQSQKLVHQAWNPGDTPPTNDERKDLLTKALEVINSSPAIYGRHRYRAVTLIRAALEEIKLGDTNNKVTGLLRDADAELREAVSESH